MVAKRQGCKLGLFIRGVEMQTFGSSCETDNLYKLLQANHSVLNESRKIGLESVLKPIELGTDLKRLVLRSLDSLPYRPNRLLFSNLYDLPPSLSSTFWIAVKRPSVEPLGLLKSKELALNLWKHSVMPNVYLLLAIFPWSHGLQTIQQRAIISIF